jgi:UDP-glucose 4-epimerase
MSVLVTGGAGYIGSHTVHALADLGHRVVVVDDLSTGSAALLPDSAELVVGDIGDAALIGPLLEDRGVTAIVHFAGSIVVPESVENPLKYYLNNTVRSHALISAAVAAGVRNFIFSSTAAVYGEPENVPVPETAQFAPISPYGTSKMMTELMLRDVAAAHDFRYTALRYFNVAGADPKGRTGQATPNATHLIKVACQTALGQRAGLSVFGTDYPTPDGTCLRDYIHVTDLAAAHVLALDRLQGGEDSITLNCGYGRGFSVLEAVEATKRASGVDLPVTMAERRPGDPAALIAGADRIREVLGWRPEHDDLDGIVGDAFRWEQELTKHNRRI